MRMMLQILGVKNLGTIELPDYKHTNKKASLLVKKQNNKHYYKTLLKDDVKSVQNWLASIE